MVENGLEIDKKQEINLPFGLDYSSSGSRLICLQKQVTPKTKQILSPKDQPSEELHFIYVYILFYIHKKIKHN